MEFRRFMEAVNPFNINGSYSYITGCSLLTSAISVPLTIESWSRGEIGAATFYALAGTVCILAPFALAYTCRNQRIQG